MNHESYDQPVNAGTHWIAKSVRARQTPPSSRSRRSEELSGEVGGRGPGAGGQRAAQRSTITAPRAGVLPSPGWAAAAVPGPPPRGRQPPQAAEIGRRGGAAKGGRGPARPRDPRHGAQRRRLAEEPAVGHAGGRRDDQHGGDQGQRHSPAPPERACGSALRGACEILSDVREIGRERTHGEASPPLMTARIARRARITRMRAVGSVVDIRSAISAKRRSLDHAQLEGAPLVRVEVAERGAQLQAGPLGGEPVVRVVDLDGRGICLLHPQPRARRRLDAVRAAGTSGIG